MKQAFLLLSCQLSNSVIETFNEIVATTNSEKNITCLLYHQKGGNHQKVVNDKYVFSFSDEILIDLKYKPLGEKLIPGNNLFHY